jgi:hypothetical protein
MALEINSVDNNVGISAPKAYAKICALHYDVDANRVDVFVNIYADEAARTAGKSPIDGGVFSGIPGETMPSLDGTIPGLRAAVYAWLKTQTKFAGSVDLLVAKVAPVVEAPVETPVP